MAKASEKSSTVIIEIKKDLSLNSISKTLGQVIKKVETGKKIIVKLIAIDNIDLAGVQLIYSIKKYAEEKGLEFEFKPDITNETISLLANSGFKNLFVNHP
jgi:hypothetical protein